MIHTNPYIKMGWRLERLREIYKRRESHTNGSSAKGWGMAIAEFCFE